MIAHYTFVLGSILAWSTGAFGQAHADDPPSTIIAHHHASTAMEGYLRGLADYQRSQFDGQVSMAEAENLKQAAHRQAIYNDNLYVSSQIASKLAREARHLARIADSRDKNLRRYEIRRTTTAGRTETLLSDARLGVFAWPGALNAPRFARQIAQLEPLLQRWSLEPAAVSPDDRQALASLVEQLRRGLQRGRGAADYWDRVNAMDAVRDLQQLASQAAPATSSGQVAMEKP